MVYNINVELQISSQSNKQSTNQNGENKKSE
jgi:hypothetical protein